MKPTDRMKDLQMKLMGSPESVEYQAIVQMPSAEFRDVCRNLATIGDTVVISVTKESVKFSTSGDPGKANVVLKHNPTADKPEEATIIRMKDPVSLAFDLEEMNSVTKATPLSNAVTLSFSVEGPMVVEYEIENGCIRFLLGLQLKGKIQDLKMKLMRNPDAVEYQAIVRMPSAKFQNICRNLASIGGDTVLISVAKESAKFSSSGDTGKANLVLRHRTTIDKPEEATIIEAKEQISLTFYVKAMNTITKVTPLSNTVTLSLSAERVMVAEYEMEKGHIRFILGLEDKEEEEEESKSEEHE